MWSVFYNVYYCILISAFHWFKIMEGWGDFLFIIWLTQTWLTHQFSTLFPFMLPLTSSQHYFYSCCHGVCWTLFQSPLNSESVICIFHLSLVAISVHTIEHQDHQRCIEPNCQYTALVQKESTKHYKMAKSTVKTQLYLLAMSGWITQQFTTICFGLYWPSSGCTTSCYKVKLYNMQGACYW